MKRVLIVCKGNTCRSPMAVALLGDMLRRHGLGERVEVLSAGIWADEGAPATIEAQRTMRERGLDISSHKAHLLSAQDVRQADLLVAMEHAIAEAIHIESPEATGKTFTLGELADDPRDVEDPIGGPPAGYRATADELQLLLQRAFARILGKLGLPA